MSIVSFYRDLIKDLSLSANKEGLVSLVTNVDENKEEPWVLDERRVVLPTSHQIQERGLAEKYLFNPLNEDVLGRESATVSAIRHLINTRLTMATAVLMSSLISVAESKGDHRKIQIKNSEFLSILKDVDAESVVDFNRLMMAAVKQSGFTKSMWSIYLKHGGAIGDKKYARVATYTCTFYDEIKDKKDKYFGISGVRVKDINMFRNLFEYVFPELKSDGAYVRGTNDDTAPYFHVLLSGFKDVAGEITCMEEIVSKVLPDETGVRFELDWAGELKDFDKFRKELRSLPTQDASKPARKVADKLTDGHNMVSKLGQAAQQAQKDYENTRKKTTHEETPPWENSKPVEQQSVQQEYLPAAPKATGTQSLSDFLGVQARPTMQGHPHSNQPQGYGYQQQPQLFRPHQRATTRDLQGGYRPANNSFFGDQQQTWGNQRFF